MGQLDIVVTKTHLSAHGDSIDIDVPWGGFEGLAAAIADLQQLVALHDVSRVSVTSNQFGVVFLDGRGRPVTDVLWADDERSADDAAWCNKKFPEQWWIEHIGETPQTRHGLTKMSWLHRSEPDVWTKIAHMCGIDDHVRRLLIDPSSSDDWIAGFVTSEEFVMSLGVASPRDLEIDHEILALIDRDRDWQGVFAPIRARGTVVGSLNGADIVI